MSANESIVEESNPAVVAGAALGAIAVLALLWFVVLGPLLSDDGGEPELEPPVATEQPPSGEEPDEEPDEEPTEVPTGEEALEELPVATYEVFLSRDPFEPVIPEPGDGEPGNGEPGDGEPGDGEPGDGEPGDGEPGDGEPGDGEPGDGEPGDGEPGDGEPDGDDCTGEDEVVCDGHVVSLVDVFVDDDGAPTAVVQVDSQLYEVQTDDVFAESFQVLSIEPPCVTLLFGDDSFTLCEGERVMK